MKKVLIEATVRNKATGLFVLFFILCMRANAQFDPMFTQYMNNEMVINPAYTGTPEVPTSTVLYRDQWVGMEGAPRTQTFSFHSPLGDKNGLGLSLINEEIGIKRLFKASGTYAYRIFVGERSRLSFGLLGGVMQYKEDYNKLVLINPDDHYFSTGTKSFLAPNAGFGMYYYTNKFYLGLSIPRMIKNTIINSEIENSASPQDWHYYLTSANVFELSDYFKLKVSGMFKYVSGAPVQGELAFHGLIQNVWWLGAAYRSGDAISVMTGFQLSPQLRIFYSYDYSVTPIQNYSSGSHEIIISYDFQRQKRRIISPRMF
jgi:type IX secretion system PorP/SprF family membrane protein